MSPLAQSLFDIASPRPPISAPGFYDIPAQDYHADPCATPSLSSSVAADLVTTSPAHVFRAHPRLSSNPSGFKTTAAMDFGSTVHELLLAKGGGVEIWEGPDWRTTESKLFKAAAEAKGATAIKRADYDRAIVCVNAVRSRLEAMGLGYVFTEGVSEQVAIWQEQGHFMRAMHDRHLPDRNLIVDMKTTGRGAHPEEIAKTVANMDYDLRSEFYLRGATALTGIPARKGGYGFLFIFIETEPPFEVVPCFLDLAFQERGKRRAQEAIDLWVRCMESGNWPGYVTGPVEITAPGWIDYEIDADEITPTGARIA